MYDNARRQRAAPQVQPVIAEILRTCVYPKPLYLRLERVVRQAVRYGNTSEDLNHRGHAIKLLLTDGKLLIQALLLRTLSNLPEIEELAIGDVLEIWNFAVRKAKRTSGQGHVIFLGIESCYVIKREGAVQDNGVRTTGKSKRTISNPGQNEQLDREIDDLAGGFIRSGSPIPDTAVGRRDSQVERSDSVQTSHVLEETTRTLRIGELGLDVEYPKSQASRNEGLLHKRNSPHITQKRKLVTISESGSDEEAFETIPVNLNTANKRRRALHELSQNVVSSPLHPAARELIEIFEKNKVEIEDEMKRMNTVKFDLDKNDYQQENEVFAGQTDINLNNMNKPLNFNQYQDQRSRVLDRKLNLSGKLLSLPMPSTSSRPTTPIHSESQLDQFGPFHDLLSLYSSNLPPKSYVFTTLVVTTYVSSHLIARPNSPFPPKRHIKVIDRSVASRFIGNKTNILGKGVTVSVYRDASGFKPTIGRVALMRGVVMQRISGAMRNGNGTSQGEVILNVYPIKSRIQRQSQTSGQRHQQPYPQHNMSQNHRKSPTQANEVNHTTHQPHDISFAGVARTPQNEKPTVHGKREVLPDDHEGAQEDPAGGHWFVDDHDFLRIQGYDVDSMQQWWNEIVNKT